MADDNSSRFYRSNDPYRRSGEPARSDDPLAELARLIGRSDPFAELGRSNARQQSQQRPAAPPAHDSWPYDPPRERHYAAEPPLTHGRQSSWNDAVDNQPTHDYSYSAAQEGGQDDRHYLDDRHSPDDQRHLERQYQDAQQYQDDGRYREADCYQDDQPYHGSADEAGHAQYAEAALHDDRMYDERTDELRVADAGDAREADHFYADNGPLDPHEDAMYDDAPHARRHSGLATALALIGCAMLGTAGAYAYRSYYGHPGSVQAPPVITADNSTPTKIVPAAAGDQQSSKAAQDRLANAGKEQVVSKQEEPVVLKELAAPAPPRVVPPAAPPQAAAPTVPSAAPNPTAPKPVRTVVIRPDGTEISGRAMGGLAPAAQPPVPTTRPATTAATTPPAPKAAAAPAPGRNGGPISLEPQAGEPAPAAAAATPARTRAAAASPTETTASTSSGFVVQLSSQRSEGEAQSAFRSLQAKFPNELGNRDPIIRRADLGSKGVFYRTMVGPFATAQEASQFCASYKAAGGQCIVPSN